MKKNNSPPQGYTIFIAIVSLYVTSPQRHQCQWSIIRFVPKYLHKNLVNLPMPWQSRCLWWETVDSWFHGFLVALKSNYVLENYSTGSDYSTDKCCIWIADEMDMTPLQGSCVGTRSTVYLYTMEQSASGTTQLINSWQATAINGAPVDEGRVSY